MGQNKPFVVHGKVQQLLCRLTPEKGSPYTRKSRCKQSFLGCKESLLECMQVGQLQHLSMNNDGAVHLPSHTTHPNYKLDELFTENSSSGDVVLLLYSWKYIEECNIQRHTWWERVQGPCTPRWQGERAPSIHRHKPSGALLRSGRLCAMSTDPLKVFCSLQRPFNSTSGFPMKTGK